MELLPDTQTPSWLGLPNNAERVLLTTQGGYPTGSPFPVPTRSGLRPRPAPSLRWPFRSLPLLVPSLGRHGNWSGSQLVPPLQSRLGLDKTWVFQSMRSGSYI